MRSLMAVVAPVLGMAFLAVLPAAAEKKAERPAVVLIERIQDVQLTDAQESKIAEIQKEFRPKVQEAAREVATLGKEEVEKIRGVLTPEQKTKLEAAKEERKEFRGERLGERIAHLHELDLTADEETKLKEIRKEYQPKIEQAMKGFEGLLTDQQKKARQDALKSDVKRREVLAALNLTDEQKAKAEATGKEVCNLVREELEKMRDVMTEGQKEKLQEFKDERHERVRDRHAHRIANLKDLNLTDDQKQKIAEIRKEYRPKLQEAGNKLRGTIREEMEAIVGVLKG